MKRKVTSLVLALTVFLVSAPFGVFAEAGAAAGDAELLKVEAQDISETGAKLVWNPDNGYEPSEDVTFSIFDGEEALAEDLELISEDNIEGYSFDDDGYSYVVEGLEAGTDYELEVVSSDAAEESAVSGKVSFTTEAAEEEADAVEEEAEEEAAVEEDEEAVVEAEGTAEAEGPDFENISAPAAGSEKGLAGSFKAAAVGNKKSKNSIKLTWKAVENAAKYKLVRTEDDSTVEVKATSASSYTKKIAAKKTGTYTYKIQALDASGNVIDEAESVAKIPKITIKASNTKATTKDLTVTIPSGFKGKYRIVSFYKNRFTTLKIITKEKASGKMTVKYTAKNLVSAQTYQFYVVNNNTGVVTEKITGKTAVADVSGLKKISSAKAVILKWNKVPRATSYVITRTGNGTTKKFTTKKLTYLDDTVAQDVMYTYKVKAKKSGYASSKKAATVQGDAIRTMYLSIKFGTTRTLTSHTGGSVKATFPAGTVVTATGYTNGKYIFWYNGREYQVMRTSISSSSVKTLDNKRTYSGEEAMSYVNRMGLESRTPYLIWVNTYTQKLYIFKGSKGKWQIVQGPWLVASGKPSSPTSTGMTRIVDRMVSNGAPYWNVTFWFSLHGNAAVWGGLGYPKSGACVRNTNEHARWIFYNTPMQTAVYVF